MLPPYLILTVFFKLEVIVNPVTNYSKPKCVQKHFKDIILIFQLVLGLLFI